MVVFSSVYLLKQSTEKFDLENVCHRHAVQHSLWSHWMENINLYKSHTSSFFAISPFSRYAHFEIRDLHNVGQGYDVQYSQWRHSMVKT